MVIESSIYNEEKTYSVMNVVNDKVNILRKSIVIENSLYKSEKTFDKLLNKIVIDINYNNLIFLDFIVNKRMSGISLSRLNRYIYVYFKHLNRFDIKKITRDSFCMVYQSILDSNIINNTKAEELIICKMIINYYNSDINLSTYRFMRCRKKIFYDDLLTKKEKSLILASNLTIEKKVFFGIMFDTGSRVGEVFSINRNSFRKIDDGYLVRINKSKTNVRTVFVFSNVNNIDKLLKTSWETWTFSYAMSRKVLKRFEKKFGKRMYNHLARHTKATEYYNKGVKTLTLVKYFGWNSTKMLFDVYAHIDENKVIDEIRNVEKY